MPKRTVVVYQTGYHKYREPESERKMLDLTEVVAGTSFRALVESCWAQEKLNSLEMPTRDRSIEVEPPISIEDVTILKAKVGMIGETGEYKDTESGTVYHNDQRGTAAKMGTLRIGYLEPSGNPIRGYAVIEGSSNGNLREQFLRLLRTELQRAGKYTLTFDRVMTSEEWLKNQAELEKVVVLQQVTPADRAEDVDWLPSALRARIEVSPEKGKRIFGDGVFRRFRNDEFDPRSLVALPEADNEEVRIQLGDGDRSKLMAIDALKTPALLEIISEEGDDPLTDQKFAEWVVKRVGDLSREVPER